MKIAIIKAGYIGAEISAIWKKKGHQITTTTRYPEKVDHLAKISQKCVILKGTDESELAPLILNNDLILLTMSSDVEEFEESPLQMAHAIHKIAIDRSAARRLIYTGTTAIYGDHRGMWVDEDSKLKAKTEQGLDLIEAERVLLSLKDLGWHVLILRHAEVYGPGRELTQRLRSLQGKTLPGSGKTYTNMVHRYDVTAAIDYALRHHLEGIFNLADDDHPTREELYNQIAEKINLPTIDWDPNISWYGGNKRISNHKIKSKGFSFHYSHRTIN